MFGLMLPLVDRKPELRLLVETPQIGTIVGDPGKLRQILLNLVGNAVKFTERGAVTLAVSEAAGSNGRRMLRFEVSDTGIGVAADRLEAIFDPFTQSDVTVGRRFGGSGLGLAICRRLVDRLGGEIGVDSRLGEGSRFWFTMPLEPSVGATAAAPDRAAARRKRASVALDLLVVEDNEVNAMVASGLLARAGHKAIIASTGAEALALFDSRDFDAVLMDLRLPDFDGLEVVRRMRASADAKKSRTPIIVQSAHVLASDIEACVAAGVNEFVGKPFKLERLQAALRRVASPAALRRSARRPVAAPAAASAPPWQSEAAADVAVDDAVLAEHVAQLGFEQTARIVAAFEASVAGAPAEIERLALAGDRRALAAIAHRLKSSSMHVGLARLSRLADTLETRALGESLDVARDGGRTRRRLPRWSRFARAVVRPDPRASTGEHIADAVDGDDSARLGWIVLDLASEPADQHVDRAVERVVAAPADVVDQAVARADAAAVDDQRRQQLEFGARQTQLFAGRRGQRPMRDVERPTAEGLLRFVRRAKAGGGDAPGEVLRPRQQLAHVVGLGHIVVGAELERDDAIDGIVARRDHDDADLGLPAQFTQQR